MQNELEKKLFESVEKNTPDYIKNNNILDISNPDEFVFTLKKEHLEPYDKDKNPEGLNLNSWFKNYAKEAAVSTAGIRGPQNILYPHDSRFPINLIGVMLATYAKALVARDRYNGKKMLKLVGREVRYNSEKFLDLIARIQAAQDIETLTTFERKTMPIWMASFLAFKLDLMGGEYITSSHGISVKNATKDLNSQGSQYLPEESMRFVDKIKEIFEKVEKDGSYEIKIAANDDKNINDSFMKSINDGIDLYKEYLQNGVANIENIDLIKKLKEKIVIENVGGSAYRTLSKLLEKLGISDKYVWMNIEEDAFFHGIGKYDEDPKGNKCFYDYSVDATVLSKDKEGNPYFPVIKTLKYDEKLKDFSVSTPVFITDPDHDRLTVAQIENEKNIDKIKKAGIDYVKLDEGRVLSILTANQSFLLIMDFWAKQLKESGQWNNHPRFIIKTTASAKSWDEWAKANDVKVINVPVGFKEIANIMKKVEKQITDFPNEDVVITDVFGNDANLGKNPRVIFAGEESGGMIIGAEELIKSKAGRVAIAMREKSATEAIIVASALAAKLEKQNETFSQALSNLFDENEIIGRYDVREDIAYYNESEPDIQKLTESKVIGEAKRTKNDLFYLAMAIAKNRGNIGVDDVKVILSDTFKDLKFENLIDIKFVGDGTYLEFDDKFIEIRPSGTDAKTKAYGAGKNKEDIKKYAQKLGNYSGDLTEKYNNLMDKNLYDNAKDISMEEYQKFTDKDANNTIFKIPDYKKTLGL
ncbi:MAG: hypothetical protein PHV37_06700 [Candidatus Gastranaerophilales bacterium]|nr:hypothetical protein [Candidatus Gastranaerophilales bacterium]